MQGLPAFGHEPVMVGEVLRFLDLEHRGGGNGARGEGKLVVMDCTLGRGGHALQIAQAMHRARGGVLVALDVDPENLKFARKRLEEAGVTSGQQAGGGGVELRTFHANFAEAADVLEVAGIKGLDALLADFGVSTNQLLDSKHGLSFSAELPLDMRLDPRINKSAADVLATWSEKELAAILQEYAQERFAWRIARKIVQTRMAEPILTTGQLARLVRSVVPAQHGQIDPATRTFQALRMAVNSELQSIEDLLAGVPQMMNPGGRAAFISFHSGEDRLVKQASRHWEAEDICRVLTKKPVEPGPEEMKRNPRSRSAKLRAVEFTGSAVMDDVSAN